MNLTEKLRQQQRLKQRNDAQLISGLEVAAGIVELPLEATARESSLADRPSPILEQLNRMRRKLQKSCVVAEERASCGEIQSCFEGAVQTNSKGSFVHLSRTTSGGRLPNASGGLLAGFRRLVELLSGENSGFDLSRVAFLDTETTGLSSGAGTHAFLVGVGSWDDSGFRVEQYFMRDYHEERAMLLALQQRLSGLQVMVTFNGKSFDAPLLQSRFVLARQKWPLTGAIHLDLLHPARRLWKLRLGDCSLGNLELQLLQRRRERDVPGSEIPRLYFHYTRTGNPAGIREILGHNQQDIETLAELALRISRLLCGEEAADLHPEDLFSTGKYLRVLGEQQLASVYTQSALKNPLGSALEFEALQMLAGLLKSRREYRQAAALWKRMIEKSSAPPEEICEELAIHYEHRQFDLHAALNLTNDAIGGLKSDVNREKWQHRRQRLLRKIEKQTTSVEPFLFA